MKTKLLLLLIAAVMLCGCEHLGQFTYYTFINATDKTITVTLYDQDFYTNEWQVEVNPDAKEVFCFIIAPGEQYTRILPPYPSAPKASTSPPFEDIKEARCITVSNGELIVSHRSPDGLFYQYSGWYEKTKSTNKSVHLQIVFDDVFFNTQGQPVPVYE